MYKRQDQVIDGIVPIVGTTYPDEHLLKGYFDSLEKLKHQYGDCLILPAHKEPCLLYTSRCV